MKTTHENAACCAPDCCAPAATATDAPYEIKRYVREKYAEVVLTHEGCCGDACCGADTMAEDYAGEPGYEAEADLGLGCGLPTREANLKPGQTVLDLGSGAGIDAFVARSVVGETGRVIGVDLTPEMVARARRYAERLGYENVSFLEGDIEALPLPPASVDVVVSNCVLNLVPDKVRAFAEMHRVLRPGGHFCISDIAVRGAMPEAVRRSAEAWAGCVAGAMDEDAYLSALRTAGFRDVRVVRERAIPLGWDDEAAGAGLFSITVYGERP